MFIDAVWLIHLLPTQLFHNRLLLFLFRLNSIRENARYQSSSLRTKNVAGIFTANSLLFAIECSSKAAEEQRRGLTTYVRLARGDLRPMHEDMKKAEVM